MSTSSDENDGLENLKVPEVNCEGPPKIKKSTRLTAALDKCKVSDRDAIHIISALLEALSLNINDFVLSRSSLKRSRENLRKKGATSISPNFPT